MVGFQSSSKQSSIKLADLIMAQIQTSQADDNECIVLKVGIEKKGAQRGRVIEWAGFG
jgi:hypothetical protein